MAILLQRLTHVDPRCNAGERRVLHQLARRLESRIVSPGRVLSSSGYSPLEAQVRQAPGEVVRRFSAAA